MEVHGSIEIEEGSTLIIEDGALLNVYDGGLVYVHDGGTLIDRNNTSGAGIWLGYPNYSANTAEVRIDGALKFEDGADFLYQGTGFYHFKNDPTLDLSTGSDVIWSGSVFGFKMVEIDKNVNLTLDGHPVTISDGAVAYHDYCSIIIRNSTIDIDDAWFYSVLVPGVSSTAISAESISALFDIDNATFDDFTNGLSLEDITNPLEITIDDSKFNDCNHGINATSVDKLTVTSTGFDNSYQSGSIAVKYTNCKMMKLKDCEVNNYELGADLNIVTGFYMTNGTAFNNLKTGIDGLHSKVWMRTGATITASQITAIEMHGQWSSQTGTYTSMLTMGDLGCAQIVGNLGEGVIGTNTILNIDAVIHDYQGDNNGLYDHLWFVRDPSNNTGKFFNMCYTHVSTPINVIYARRNIWVQPNNTNQNPPASTYFFTNSTVCGTQIPPPTFVPAPKSACVGSTLDCVPCEETLKEEEEEADTAATVATIITEAFSEAYADFIEEDNEETRDEFDEVAVLKLDYDSISGAYSLTTVAGEVFPVNDSTVHRILVAKVLKEDSSDTEKIDAEDIFAEHYTDLFATLANKKIQQFIVYPNPSSGKFTIQKKQDSEVSVIRISDLFGSLLYSSQIDEKISSETNRFPPGIYVIEGIGTDGIMKDIQRLVIQ